MHHGGAEKHEDVIKEIEIGFKTLSESAKQWESLCKETEKTIASYNYLHDQMTQSKRFQEDAEICTFFPDLKINLLSTIHDKMNEEMDRLSVTLCECKKIVDTLKSKHEKATVKQMSKKDESKAASRGLKSLEDGSKCCLEIWQFYTS
ncbi:hypothetical protein B566_EDAN011069 [Ephemera danica]|nr:hypothetical protein B566_EDAN011069 [Ephemera danica]